MIVVSVLYPKTGESWFDHDYYAQTHLPLVKSRWAGKRLERIDIVRGKTALGDGRPGFDLIGQLTFTLIEDMQAAFAAAGNEILEDISRFTDVEPLIQINQPVERRKTRSRHWCRSVQRSALPG